MKRTLGAPSFPRDGILLAKQGQSSGAGANPPRPREKKIEAIVTALQTQAGRSARQVGEPRDVEELTTRKRCAGSNNGVRHCSFTSWPMTPLSAKCTLGGRSHLLIGANLPLNVLLPRVVTEASGPSRLSAPISAANCAPNHWPGLMVSRLDV